MAYNHETGRYRNDPLDPNSRSGMRPHEFPASGDTGFGGLAVMVVLLLLVGVFILASAFGENTGTADGVAPATQTVPSGVPEQ